MSCKLWTPHNFRNESLHTLAQGLGCDEVIIFGGWPLEDRPQTTPLRGGWGPHDTGLSGALPVCPSQMTSSTLQRSSAACGLRFQPTTSSPHEGLPNSNRQPVNGSTDWVGFLTLGAGETATRTSHLPFPAALSPRRGWVPSAATQQKVPESQGYFWDSWKLVPGPGLQERGESGLWWFCSVCRSRISSELHTPSPPSSRRLESTAGKGGNTERGGMQGGWVKTPGPGTGATLTFPRPRHAPPSKAQLSLTPDVVLAAPTVGVSYFPGFSAGTSPHEECR